MADFVQADLDRIKKAITQGVRKVKFSDGREVEFSTFEELVDRYHFIAKDLGLEAGRQRLLSEFKKGVSS